MSHSEAPISFTVKINGDLFTIRGNDSAEFVEHAMQAPVLIEWCKKIQEAAAGIPSTATVSAPAPAVQAPTPAAPPAVAPAAQQAHACQHGPMVYRTSKPGMDPWKGWFCPLPKDTAGRCKTVYER